MPHEEQARVRDRFAVAHFGSLAGVVLVVLVFFLVAEASLQKEIHVWLVPVDRLTTDTQIVLEYRANRGFSINFEPVTLADMETRLRRVYEDRRDKGIFIEADGSLRYGDLVAALDAAKGAGADPVVIVTPKLMKDLYPNH